MSLGWKVWEKVWIVWSNYYGFDIKYHWRSRNTRNIAAIEASQIIRYYEEVKRGSVASGIQPMQAILLSRDE